MEDELRDEIRDHFGRAFESENPEPEDGILDSVMCYICESLNENLTRDVTEEEVRLAAYQLD